MSRRIMKERLKRKACLLIAMMMLAGNISVMAEETEVNDYAKTKTVFAWGGEESTGRITGNFTKTVVDEEHGESLVIDSSEGLQKVGFYSEGPEESEMDIISFDLYCETKTVKGYTSLLKTKGSDEKRMFYIREAGTLTVQKAMEGSLLAGIAGTRSYEEKTWYHLDACVDYQERKVSYYVDGVGLGVNDLPDDVTVSGGLNYTLEMTGAGGKHILDNISIIQIFDRGKPLDINPEITYPESIVDPKILSNNQLGSIYFTQDAVFQVRVENEEAVDKDFEVSYIVKDENGFVEDTGALKVNVKAGNEEFVDITASVKGHGFYTIDAYVKDIESGSKKHSQKAFSVANGPKDGELNAAMGVANHFNMGHGVGELERKTELFKNAGFGGMRESYLWADVVKQDGVFEFLPVHIRADEALYANGMTRFAQLAVNNPAISPEYPPVSDEAVAKFAEYAYNVVKNNKVLWGVEIWNEWDLEAGSFNRDRADCAAYVKLSKAVYEAVKRANPDVKVYGLGGCCTWQFIDEFLTLGGGEYCDGVSWHPYPGGATAQVAYDKILMKWKEVMIKHGYGDMPIVLSEFNWTGGFVSDEDQANYAIQYSAMTQGELETIYWYVSQEKPGRAGVHEKKYGMIRADNEVDAEPYEPYSAKPEFLALSNWNTLMVNSKPLGKVSLENSNITAYRYKDKHGKDVCVYWNDSAQEEPAALRLDTNSVTVYDIYGTGKKMTAEDGVFDVLVSKAPHYIIGNFNDIKAEEVSASIGERSLEVIRGDEAKFTIKKNFEGDANIKIETSPNIEITQKGEFINGEATIVAKIGNEPIENEVIRILVTEKSTGKERLQYDLPVVYKEPISYKVYAERFRSRRWKYTFELENNANIRKVSGKIVFDEPEYLTGREFSFNNLSKGQKKDFWMSVPENINYERSEVKGRVLLSTGEEIPFAETVNYVNFVECETAPVIDGKLEKREWNTDSALKLKFENQVKRIIPWSEKDISADMYFMWDKQYFYFAAEVEDNVHCDTDSLKRIWSNDSIQFAFAEKNETGARQTKYEVGASFGEQSFVQDAYFGTDAEYVGMEDKYRGDGQALAITRDEKNKVTYYEVRMPWIDIFGKPINPALHDEFYFCVLINDNDGAGRKGWMELCPGIGDNTDSANFAAIPVSSNNGW